MSKLAAVCLHYGKEYFEQALQSVRDHVDEIVIFYSAKASHGTSTPLTCPDSREELWQISHKYKCTWNDITGIHAENHHRYHYEKYAANKSYDQVIILDSDEVHISEEVPKLFEAAADQGVKRIGMAGSQWVTLYRSFNDYVTDGFAPIRVLNMKKPEGNVAVQAGFIYHMGYAIPDKLMEYKISCHGHHGDFMNNNRWYQDKWLGYNRDTSRYLHPATQSYWIKTEPFDKNTLPQLLKDHPNFHKDRIS